MTQKATTSFTFLRAAVALASGIILVALVLDLLLLGMADEQPADTFNAEFALIETLLAGSPDIQAAFEAQQTALADALGMPVTLHTRDDFAGLQANPGSDIITLYDSSDLPIHYKPIPDTRWLLAIGPVPDPQPRGLNPRLLSLLYYGLVGLLILLWIRPFVRDLDRLRSAALKFGANDFSARVEVPPDSRILPVARSFNAMAERIEYLVSSHRELTNAVSHELRTPLARFKFSMEILARTEDAAKKEEYLRHMKQDVEELEGLIDEMLSYARLNEQNLQIHPINMDLRPWLEALVSAYENEPVAVHLVFSPESSEPLTTTFDPALMSRALNNILRNCMRYAESQIEIRVSQHNGVTDIYIQDDGKGIAPDKLATIFEPFTRGDTSRDRQSGGYGLGLAIAARIVQRHHGFIEASNVPPQGALFSLRWPAP